MGSINAQQASPKNNAVNKNKPLVEHLKKIENKSNLKFYFKTNWIKDIGVSQKNQQLAPEKMLNKVLEPRQLSFIKYKQNHIIIIPEGYSYFIKNDKISYIKTIGTPMDKGKYKKNNVQGHVYFGKTGEPIAGVLVEDKKNNILAVSDYTGYYDIQLPGGVTQLEFSFMGLETNVVDVEVLSHGKMDVELMEAPIAIDAVTVSANGYRNNVERTQMGMVQMDMKNLKKLPVLMGEADIIKGMTLLPGVSTSGEMSSGFNVRGGNTDQNLILLNGAPIYGTTHLFGLFSTLIPVSVQSVDLHKGTQPAKYGTRVSSVMEIKLKSPDTAKVKGKAGVGLLNSSVFVEGPLVKNRISFMVGARSTYSNWMLKQIPDIDIKNSKAGFYDLIGKIDIRVNPKNNLSVFGYFGHDNFTYSNINKYSYGSLVAGIKHSAFFNRSFTLQSTLSTSDYNSEVAYFEHPVNAYIVESGIWQANARTELKYNYNSHEFLTGFEGVFYSINPGNRDKENQNSLAVPKKLDEEKALEGAFFLQDDIKVFDKLSFSAGLRFSAYSKLGIDTTFLYEENQPLNENTIADTSITPKGNFVNPFWGLEPRLGIKYALNETSSVKLGFNITRQYQHLITNTSAATPSDFWKSAGENIPPIISKQLALGFFKNLLSETVESSVEVYYKTLDNVLEYKNGAVLSMNPNIEQDIIPSKGKSYGMELMLKKNIGDFTGWLGYTLSKTLIKTPQEFKEETINNGDFYEANNHKLHDFNLSVNYQITRRWTFGGNFLYSSGRPTTFPEKKYSFHQNEVVFYSDRNKYKLPAYHRLDVSVTYEGFLKKAKKVHPSFTFSIFNVYGHKNIFSTYYKRENPNAGNNYQKFGLYQLSIIGVPVPSLTINIDF